MIRLTIDGKTIETGEGRTILEIAEENGVSIPKLCFHKNLLPITSCRLCIVEIEGYEKPVTSCDTLALDGMSVTTNSENLMKMRQEYLKFLLINHPLECPVCDSAGECRLQDLCFEHKIEKVDIAPNKQAKSEEPYATALIRYAKERCVLCLRCVHACREVSGRGVLEIVDTGIDARMEPVNKDNCISCGECLHVCPVGALTERQSPLKSRKWQTKRTATTCPHCGFGCSIIADVYGDKTITKILTDDDALPNKGSLCVMGRFGYDYANHDKRLSAPSVKDENGVKQTSLTEAVETIAARFTRLSKEGKRVGFIVSPRATNEEIMMLLQIAGCFPMSVIGTAAQYHTGPVLDCLKKSGIPYPYSYEDLKDCDLIITAGADLLANNHLLADRVRDAVKRSGSRVAVIDPSPTGLTAIADSWLKPAPGTDAFLFNTLAKRITENKIAGPDAAGLEDYNDYAAIFSAVDEEAALAACGIGKAAFDKFYNLFTKARKIAFIFGSGITSCDDSLAALINLCLLRGIHKTGVILPTALQSNAVGALSILANSLTPDKIVSDPSIGGLFLYEDDPYHYLNPDIVTEGLKNKSIVAVCEALPTEAADLAAISVPTGTFAEKKGTFIAEDGFIRTVRPVRSPDSTGFEFLRLLLNKLCGGLYQSEKEAYNGLLKKGLLTNSENNIDCLLLPTTGNRFLKMTGPAGGAETGNAYTLVLRNTFLNHHIADKDVYAKLAYLNNPAITGDKLFISPEDASELNISDGDTVSIESTSGAIKERATIKPGLKKGVVEYRMLRKRKDVLKLNKSYSKHIAVTLKKG